MTSLPAVAHLHSCPAHLTPAATEEWQRVVVILDEMGILTGADRAALAAYCQAYGRWVEAEEKLRETPMLFKTPSGYVQQSPWLGIVHKQLELMGRYMTELGMTPAARSRVIGPTPTVRGVVSTEPMIIKRIILAGPEDDTRRSGYELEAAAWAEKHCGPD